MVESILFHLVTQYFEHLCVRHCLATGDSTVTKNIVSVWMLLRILLKHHEQCTLVEGWTPEERVTHTLFGEVKDL